MPAAAAVPAVHCGSQLCGQPVPAAVALVGAAALRPVAAAVRRRQHPLPAARQVLILRLCSQPSWRATSAAPASLKQALYQRDSRLNNYISGPYSLNKLSFGVMLTDPKTQAEQWAGP